MYARPVSPGFVEQIVPSVYIYYLRMQKQFRHFNGHMPNGHKM